MNADNAALTAAINSLMTALGSIGSSSAGSMGLLLTALFYGSNSVLIGKGSYSQSTSGTSMMVSPGFAWNATTSMVVQSPMDTTLNFAGQPAGTYYVNLGPNGIPEFDSTATNALYVVVWSGTAFTSVTLHAATFLDSAAETDLLTSTALSTTYATVLARLEYIENHLGGGGGGGVTITQLNATPSAAGPFQIAHGLGSAPRAAWIALTSNGPIWFQSVAIDGNPMFDGTNVYLKAQDGGLTGIVFLLS
jgi:hypothetical protein